LFEWLLTVRLLRDYPIELGEDLLAEMPDPEGYYQSVAWYRKAAQLYREAGQPEIATRIADSEEQRRASD
jgi:hypothetical protein